MGHHLVHQLLNNCEKSHDSSPHLPIKTRLVLPGIFLQHHGQQIPMLQRWDQATTALEVVLLHHLVKGRKPPGEWKGPGMVDWMGKEKKHQKNRISWNLIEFTVNENYIYIYKWNLNGNSWYIPEILLRCIPPELLLGEFQQEVIGFC